MLGAGESHLPNATVKLFDSTGMAQPGQAISHALAQNMLKDGNGTGLNDNLTAGTDQHLNVPPKTTLNSKDCATETLVHRPSKLGHRLARSGIVIH